MAGGGARFEFFINRWVQLFDFLGKSLSEFKTSTSLQLTAKQTADLNVVLGKAVRARKVLEELQELDKVDAHLRATYEEQLGQLKDLENKVSQEDLSKMVQFAEDEGLRLLMGPITGEAMTSEWKWKDPFGVRLALHKSHPEAVFTWKDYSQKISLVSTSTKQVTSGPPLAQLAHFHLHRQAVLREMKSLRQQLEGQVDLPPLEPLEEANKNLGAFLKGLRAVHHTHVAAVKKALSQVDLHWLEMKVMMTQGASYPDGDMQKTMQSLQSLSAEVQKGNPLTREQWKKLEAGLVALGDFMEQQEPRNTQLEVNIHRYEKDIYDRLAQAHGGGTG